MRDRPMPSRFKNLNFGALWVGYVTSCMDMVKSDIAVNKMLMLHFYSFLLYTREKEGGGGLDHKLPSKIIIPFRLNPWGTQCSE
jgi:hypothetical protein